MKRTKIKYFVITIAFLTILKVYQNLRDQQNEGFIKKVLLTFTDINFSKRVSVPKDFCLQYDLFLTVILSKPSNFDRREMIRKTWKDFGDNIYFLMGISADNATEDMIQQESLLCRDIIQIQKLESKLYSYEKSMTAIKLTSICPHIPYFLKMKDDTLINFSNLKALISNRHYPEVLLAGHSVCNARPVRNPRSLAYVPFDIYPYKVYPKYLSGDVYLMSYEVAKKLYDKMVTDIRRSYLGDVLGTGILPPIFGIPVEDHPGFLPRKEYFEQNCVPEDLMAVFGLTVEEMRTQFEVIKSKEKKLCKKKKTEKLPFSSFSWFFQTFFTYFRPNC